MQHARRSLKALIPRRHRNLARIFGQRFIHAGRERFCPCCGSHVRRFQSFGDVPRPDARCPVCGALERHRLASLFFRDNPELLAGARRVLHVAPETPLANVLDRPGERDYVSVDVDESNAMTGMNLGHIPDDTFDAAFCNRVLEHVDEDRRAMREMHRVLRPGGWAIVQVPVKRRTTVENPPVADPEEGRPLSGRRNHVRVYGWDIGERLAEAGFSVSVAGLAPAFDETTIRRCGLNTREVIFHCRKPVRAEPDASAVADGQRQNVA